MCDHPAINIAMDWDHIKYNMHPSVSHLGCNKGSTVTWLTGNKHQRFKQRLMGTERPYTKILFQPIVRVRPYYVATISTNQNLSIVNKAFAHHTVTVTTALVAQETCRLGTSFSQFVAKHYNSRITCYETRINELNIVRLPGLTVI